MTLNLERGMDEAADISLARTSNAMSPEQALQRAQQLIVERFRGKPVRIYEAGGGSVSSVPLDEFKSHRITVVDIDDEQLRNNRYADEKILGNIETHRFPPGSFEIVVCHNVIEHLKAPDEALRRFYEALVPGGLVFISAPNPLSFFGMLTKYTPHWFHVLMYRLVLRDRNAGKPGMHPFRTVYHPIVAPRALHRFAQRVGYETVHITQFTTKHLAQLRETRPAVAGLLEFGIGVLDLLTLRRLPLLLGDYHVILRKPASIGRADIG